MFQGPSSNTGRNKFFDLVFFLIFLEKFEFFLRSV